MEDDDYGIYLGRKDKWKDNWKAIVGGVESINKMYP